MLELQQLIEHSLLPLPSHCHKIIIINNLNKKKKETQNQTLFNYVENAHPKLELLLPVWKIRLFGIRYSALAIDNNETGKFLHDPKILSIFQNTNT